MGLKHFIRTVVISCILTLTAAPLASASSENSYPLKGVKFRGKRVVCSIPRLAAEPTPGVLVRVGARKKLKWRSIASLLRSNRKRDKALLARLIHECEDYRHNNEGGSATPTPTPPATATPTPTPSSTTSPTPSATSTPFVVSSPTPTPTPTPTTSSTPSPTSTPAPSPICSDGLDNDLDGRTDFPADPGCSSAEDGDEADQTNNSLEELSCAEVATITHGSLFYFDPVNGDLNNDGRSEESSWGTLEDAASNGKLTDGLVRGGDVLCLREGFHGKVLLRDAIYTAPVVIMGEKDSEVTAEVVHVEGSENLVLANLSISPWYADEFSTYTGGTGLLRFKDSRNVTVSGAHIFSAPKSESRSWDVASWEDKTSLGVLIMEGSERISVIDSEIHTVGQGVKIHGPHCTIRNNTIEWYTQDGIIVVSLASNSGSIGTTIEENTIQDVVQPDPTSQFHVDAIQIQWSQQDQYPITLDTTIRGNRIYKNTAGHPNPAFVKDVLQGIGNFATVCVNCVVENNIVVTEHPANGIAFTEGAIGTKILNNTVYGYSGQRIVIQPATKDLSAYGIELDDNLVFNNLVFNSVSNKIQLQGDNYLSGNNLGLDTTDAPFYLANPDGLDLHLREGSPAIDAGESGHGSAQDFEGTNRPGDGDGDGIAATDIGADELEADPS